MKLPVENKSQAEPSKLSVATREKTAMPRKGLDLQIVGAVVGLGLLCLLAAGAVRNTQSLIRNARWVAHTHEVIGKIGETFSSTQDVETGMRGYLLTGNKVFLDPYLSGTAGAREQLAELRRLMKDNQVQQSRLNILESAIIDKLAFAENAIRLKTPGEDQSGTNGVALDEGRRLMDTVRREAAEMKRTEEQLLLERHANLESSTTNAMVILGGGVVFSCGLLLLVFQQLRREIARRTQIEESLRQSEESLAVTLNSIGDGVLATDTEGKITRMNRVAEQLTGWNLAEANDRPIGEIFNIINEKTRAPAVIPVGAVLATGEIQGLENHTVLIARDGTQCAIADSAAPIRDRYGRILGVVLVFRDVSEERVAELKLEAALAQLDRFFSLSLDFLCIASADGYFKRISPAVKEVLGWSVEEFLAQPYIAFIHPDDHAATLQEVEEQVTQGKKVFHFENRYRHKDGSWRVLSWRSTPQPGGLMYATARDVTELKRTAEQIQKLNTDLRHHATEVEAANAELHRSRAELRSMFESLPGLYLVLKPDLTIVTASEAYLKATLTRREEIIGRDLFDVFPDNPDDLTANGVSNLRASLERVRQSGVPDTMAIQKYDVRRADGTFELKYWSPINSPMLGADDKVEYIIHRVEDVTEFVRQKPQPAGTESGLRIRLEQMEAEIFQSSQKVQTVNQQLQAANKELESFSYSVSHDLRAPLRHIQGYVEMLTRESQATLSEKSQRYLKTIANAGREMGQLIDDLLAFSRMGRSEMHESVIDLDRLVQETRRNLELSIGSRNIRWSVAPLPPVQGDAAMLKQVFANLLSNAIKYTGPRDPAEIEVGCSGQEEGRLIFFVKDNGAGFDMRYADKLFGVFQRLHRADEFEGTGIGLANVKRIITRHGGRTWAEGKVNAGATFYFTLKPAPVK